MCFQAGSYFESPVSSVFAGYETLVRNLPANPNLAREPKQDVAWRLPNRRIGRAQEAICSERGEGS